MWAYESVFYQIYPIGLLRRAARQRRPYRDTQHPQSRPTGRSTSQSLAANAVYLFPAFRDPTATATTPAISASVDCRLGTNEDFAAVCAALHQNGIRVVLDGVFNHVGRGFWAFRDVQEKKWDSPYKDWFHINIRRQFSGYNDGFWYEGWEGHYELVKLNLKNPAVVDSISSAASGFWVDGVRHRRPAARRGLLPGQGFPAPASRSFCDGAQARLFPRGRDCCTATITSSMRDGHAA